jgi:phage baseplate assembly protein W
MDDLKFIGSRTGEFIGDLNDIAIVGGDIDLVSGSDRLLQDMIKVLLTEKGLMPYPNYGSALPYLRGSNYSDPNLLSLVSDEVLTALRYLYLIEESDVKTEQLGEITTMDVEFSGSSILVTIAATTAARTAINLNLEV